jgi:hypothetical protein
MAKHRRRKMGAMSTGTVVAIGAGVLVLGYLMMSKSTTAAPAYAPGVTYVPSNTAANNLAIAQSNNQAGTTQTIVNDASDDINNLFTSIFS